jgi:hypothetical protein
MKDAPGRAPRWRVLSRFAGIPDAVWTITAAWLDSSAAGNRRIIHRAVCWRLAEKQRVSLIPETGDLGSFRQRTGKR